MSRRVVDGVMPQNGKLYLETQPEIVDKICNVLRIGSHIEVAAAINGIGYNTLRSWIIKGKEDQESIYGKFYQAVEKAFSEAETRDLATIDQFANGRDAVYEMEVVRDSNGSIERTADGKPMTQVARDSEGNAILKRSEIRPNWQAAAWKLARRYPKRWSSVDRGEESSVMDTEQDQVAPQEKEIITVEQKHKKIAEVRQLVRNLEALEDDPYLKS